MSTVLKEKLDEMFAELTPREKAEVVDFVAYKLDKAKKEARKPLIKKRIIGLHDGQGWISEDFNAELPDAFWFGEDSNLVD